MRKKILIAIVLFLLYMVWRLQVDFYIFPSKDSDVHACKLVNEAVFEEFLKPNSWNYSVNFKDYPTISVTRLEYEIGNSVYLTRRCEDLGEAEELFVDVYTDFLSRLNSIPSIRPFLGEFPLTPDSVEIALAFWGTDGKRVSPPAVASMYISNGIFTLGRFRSPCLEPFLEKTVESVNGLKKLYRQGVPRTQKGPKPEIPTYHFIWQTSEIGNEFFGFGDVFARNNDLEPVALTVSKRDEGERPFEFAFRGSQRLSLPEARRLIAACARSFLLFTQNSKIALSHIKARKAWINERYFGDVPEKNHFALRISFWDEYVNRIAEPYIAEIRVIGDSFKYYTADEGQRLVLIYEESWDDAMKFLEQETTSQEREGAPQQSEVKIRN